MCPYLLGIHQTLYSWREGNDEDGWKLSRRELTSELLERLNEFDKESQSVFEPSSRFRDNVFALESLMECSVPRRAPVLLQKFGWVSYGIGDVSSNGYGVAVYIGQKIHYVYGK